MNTTLEYEQAGRKFCTRICTEQREEHARTCHKQKSTHGLARSRWRSGTDPEIRRGRGLAWVRGSRAETHPVSGITQPSTQKFVRVVSSPHTHCGIAVVMGGIRNCRGQLVCGRDGMWSTAITGGGRGENPAGLSGKSCELASLGCVARSFIAEARKASMHAQHGRRRGITCGNGAEFATRQLCMQ